MTALILVLILGQALPLASKAQTSGNAASTQIQYADTADGLKQFLSDCLNMASSGDKSKLDISIRGTEIPDYAQFFRKTWPGPAESWIVPYGSGLKDHQIYMENLLTYLSHEKGEIVIRKVNDNPQGGKGMEWGMLQSLAQPLEIYYASWKTNPGPPVDQRDLVIGYFFFVDNAFRWDSNFNFSTQVLSSVDPIYPYPSTGSHPTGLITLTFNLNKDGTVSQDSIKLIPSRGTVDDPMLVKAAENAIILWRYLPPKLFPTKIGPQMRRLKVAPNNPSP